MDTDSARCCHWNYPFKVKTTMFLSISILNFQGVNSFSTFAKNHRRSQFCSINIFVLFFFAARGTKRSWDNQVCSMSCGRWCCEVWNPDRRVPYQKRGLLVTNGQQVPDTSNDVVDGQKQQDLKVLLKSFWKKNGHRNKESNMRK